MKKFIAVVAVLALTLMASVAMAQVTVDGSIEFLMRSFKNTNDWNDAVTGAGDYQNTYERIRLGVNAKHEGVKGRFQIETDWDQWGDGAVSALTTTAVANPGFETRTNGTFSIREGWIDFGIPGAGAAHIKVGRQFLQLGNGWFFRSAKYGSDAWLVGLPGKNTIAFVDVKATENNSTLADDTDAYVLLDNFKIDDTKTVGAFVAMVRDRRGTWTNNAFAAVGGNAKKTDLDTLGLWFNGTVGPVKLQAEIDIQQGETTLAGGSKLDHEGNQIVLQASMPMDALTINATLASGSGNKAGTATKLENMKNFLDKDPRYTLIYEYLMKTAGGNDLSINDKNSGFSNTQAIGLGAMYKVNKMISVGADIWMLSANEAVNLNANPGAKSDDLGTELDVKLNLTLADQLTWNTVFGYFMTGDAYKSGASADPNFNAKADDVTAIQSVLSYKF